MDKQKSILNVTVSILFKFVTMILVIVVKRFLIQICGNEVNGLNSLYISIIGFLSVAELGVGSAITFCMYKPIVEGDEEQVSALYHLFQKLYLIIGGIIFIAGLLLTPFLPYFAKDYAVLNVNLYSTFLLVLASVVLTYLFGAKTSLINAYKNNYITTAISSSGLILRYVLQILVLQVTESFEWYLFSRIIAVLVQWFITEWITRRKYGAIISKKGNLSQNNIKIIVKNIKAMFMHKIGSTLVNTVDSTIISIFLGVASLGLYSNYSAIMTSMTGILVLIFQSLTSVVGHLYVEKGSEVSQKYHEKIHFINFALGMIFYSGYFAVIDDLISILFFENLVVERAVSFIIALNGFVSFMRRSTLLFRDATGTFYYDRWKPILEGITNLILSVIFVKVIGTVGVIAATVVTDLLICHVVEPYVLYRYAFKSSPKRYYVQNYGMIVLFICVLFAQQFFMRNIDNRWVELVVNGCISLTLSGITCLFATIVCYPSRLKRKIRWKN